MLRQNPKLEERRFGQDAPDLQRAVTCKDGGVFQ